MTDIYKAPEAQLHEPSNNSEYGSVEKALAGDYELKPVEVLTRAWDTLKGMKTPFWLAVIIYAVASLAVQGITILVFGMPDETSIFAISDLVSTLIAAFALTPMTAGLYMIAIKHSVGVKPQVGEIFAHYDKIIPLFLVTILMYILLAIGFVLLIIPGIYLMVAFAMVYPLMVEKNMGVTEAIKTSLKAINHKWFSMFGFMLLSLLVIIIGAIALVVGLLWAIPLVMLGSALIYRDMFGVESATLEG